MFTPPACTRPVMMSLSSCLLALLAIMILSAWTSPPPLPTQGVPVDRSQDDAREATSFRVLVFSRTAGFRHDSIEDGIEAVRTLGSAHGFAVDATEDEAAFTLENLSRYRAVIFLSTTGNILNREQRAAFERYIKNGGGYVGIHAAADTGYDWPWYGRLVGGYFSSHPRVQPAEVIVEDRDHPSTRHLPERWQRTDEWYDYRENPRGRVHVLMRLNTESYEGGRMGSDHPIAWCHEFDGGRSWYTGGGHTKDSFKEPAFLEHILGGIRWAAQRADPASDAPTPPVPAGGGSGPR